MQRLLFFYLTVFMGNLLSAQDSTVVHIWPNKVPEEIAGKHKSVITDDDSGNVKRLTDVTDPIMTVFHPDSTADKNPAVLIFPGGGYQILAIDLEGYEIAHWLNRQGITAFVLEYRVPDKQKGALQDAQRAIRLIRAHAEKWKVDPQKIGVIGFSAGGSLAARLSSRHDEKLYPALDQADHFEALPNFSLLIYPAYLAKGSQHRLSPELKINSSTPPHFIFQTADDTFSYSSLTMATALKDNEIPIEFHLYPKGKHGYGLRKDNPAGKTWPPLAEEWLKSVINLP